MIIRMVVAVVLAIAAWLSWSESRLAAHVAAARQSIATFDYTAVDALEPSRGLSDYFPVARPLADDIHIAKATQAYWMGRYEAVAVDSGEADAEMLLAAANAAYRASMRALGTGPSAAQKLDGVLQAYALAMKAVTEDEGGATAREAAYNYEFVARLRDQVARGPRGKAAATARPAGAPVMGGDLPAGPTIHGGPGGPPPDAKTEEFQIIMPMEYGDREAQPLATPGARRERKG
jgi:hypothetical protein